MRQPQDANSTLPAPQAPRPQTRTDASLDPRLDPRYEAEIAAIERDLIAEIERVEREGAERERALSAERDAYRAQLQFVYETKGWRASVAYWNARKRGLVGALDLGSQLATYLARVGYHLGVPYRLRRDLWYRRHTGTSYQGYLRLLGQPQPAAPLDESAAPERTGKAHGPDVFVFAANAWEASDAHGQHLARLYAASGHRCRWLVPRLTTAPTGEIGIVMASAVAGSHMGEIVALALPGDGGDVTARPVFRQTALRHALRALRRYCFEQDLREVLCVVQHPGWAPLVEALRARYGWKVVYDLAHDLPDAETPDPRLADALAASDLVIASAPAQRDELARQGLAQVERVVVVAVGDDPSALSAAVRGLYGRATIIIVTYRNLEKTRLTLKSVLERTRYPNYDALLVDNGGDPEIQSYARTMAERFPATVRCIFNAENLGFAGANNVGLRAAQDSEYVVLLNDDVIVTPGWLGALLRYLDDPQIGLVGPVTNAVGNEARIPVDYSDTDGIDAFARAYAQTHDGASFDIQALAMYCLALRQRTVTALGELDERFRVG
ncbi:MAG TPA: glycosyltransferase, partial [Ktedonobacterales bacterium]|nr:glycosyltransferase [Ktedonobacterales bacterium]